MFERLKGNLAHEELESIKDLYIVELKDMLDAENQIIAALPEMAGSATTPALKHALQMHLEETHKQAERLITILHEADESGKPGKDTCVGMQGILKEGKKMLDMKGNALVKDVALIAGAQKVEHYEIVSYRTLVGFAQLLGQDDASQKLSASLKEEEGADKKLTELSLGQITLKAPMA